VSGVGERAGAWVYRGIWAALSGWFLVPSEPPHLPAHATDRVERFRPAPGFLRYLKLWFWLALVWIDIVILGLWLIVAIKSAIWGVALALPAFALAVLPDVVAYIAIYLRYDTTWYVMTDRSIRIRRGIWIIQETTITFENVQNITVHQGPVQRYYGIANVVIQTAGGGGGGHQKEGAGLGVHVGVIEGVDRAGEIRDLILSRVKASRSAGLGDERHDHDRAQTPAWKPEHLAALREVKAEAARLRLALTA
jgi:membrane protein YdbS with pleckstrin-like domain